MPSEYCTLPPVPGTCAVVLAGTADRDVGKVTVRCPDGSVLPYRTLAIAVPSSWPGHQASSTPLPDDSHGTVTGEPVLSTTIVFGLAAATEVIRLSWVVPRSMLVRSEPSDSPRLAKTTATLAAAAADAAELSEEPSLEV